MPRPANAENLLSIADISRHFQLPESTTRYYCKRFASYIPSVGDGRRRRFRPETLEIIAAILEEMKQSRTAQAVEDALAQRFPRNALAILPEHNVALASGQEPMGMSFVPQIMVNILERQTQALELIAQTFPLLVERVQAGQRNDASCADAENDSSALRKDIDNLKLLLEASEKTQQADLEQLRTWMARVIQRKDREVSE